MIIKSDFKPAWWLLNSHWQTIYPTLTRKVKAPIDRVERLELPDGDFIDLAWVSQDLPADSPLVILLHGLGGSIESTYVAGLMQACKKKGWRSVLMHFRGASKEPNRLARAYHSGDTGDFDYFLQELAQREPHTSKAAIGVSLGGNVLLKWLGEHAHQNHLVTAVGVSVPFQLGLVADRISQGFSRIYQAYLLRRLKAVYAKKILQMHEDLPEPLRNFDKWDCFWTFDEYVTAPLHGFSNVHDYYRQASSLSYLIHIKTPTLVIHALDDPFMSQKVVPQPEELSETVTLELSRRGGHVGFVGGLFPGRPVYWLEQRIPNYLAEYLQ